MMTAAYQAFISLSLKKRPHLTPVLDTLGNVLQQQHIKPFIFVDRYHFSSGQEKEMMRQARLDIDASDMLIAEASHKAIGVGIEVGYAAGRNIPIIYLRNTEAEYSTTLGGMASFEIAYTNTASLAEQLAPILSSILLKGKT
jgi:2'-deoxynucleoside 5'-phosphate N-hydrolase